MRITNNLTTRPQKISPLNFAKKISYPSFKSIKGVDSIGFGNISPLQSGLAKLDKINKAEYDSLTDAEKLALRTASTDASGEAIFKSEEEVREHVKKHFFTAEAIRTLMDDQFGEGNYVLIPIGRSLSSIGKLLSFQIGEENVKNIPMSDMERYYSYDTIESYNDNFDAFLNRPGIDILKKYLCSIGLDKEHIENSGKEYIIIDYCYTGKSLDATYRILTGNELLGNKNKNIHKVPINLIFMNIKNNFRDSLSVISSIMNDFEESNFKPYSTVARLEGRLDYIDSATDYKKFLFKEKDINLYKLFGFKLLDKEFGKQGQPFEVTCSVIKSDEAFPNQKIFNWNGSKRQQAKYDIELDKIEIFKLMRLLKEPINALRYFTKKLNTLPEAEKENFRAEFANIEETQRILKDSLQEIIKTYEVLHEDPNLLSYKYYTDFRPKLLETLKQIQQKYSIESKKEILGAMEQKFKIFSKQLLK